MPLSPLDPAQLGNKLAELLIQQKFDEAKQVVDAYQLLVETVGLSLSLEPPPRKIAPIAPPASSVPPWVYEGPPVPEQLFAPSPVPSRTGLKQFTEELFANLEKEPSAFLDPFREYVRQAKRSGLLGGNEDSSYHITEFWRAVTQLFFIPYCRSKGIRVVSSQFVVDFFDTLNHFTEFLTTEDKKLVSKGSASKPKWKALLSNALRGLDGKFMSRSGHGGKVWTIFDTNKKKKSARVLNK